ncbi:hypothetical protein [Rhodococcus sp. NPDC060176]|uniref:hypothetical protein n=1 Tax=Rhodococcus sp. NPDC060176 TaxID=3347062 RepID=UPI00364B13AA
MDLNTDWRQRMPPKSRLQDVPRETPIARRKRENEEWTSKCGPVTVRKIGEGVISP